MEIDQLRDFSQRPREKAMAYFQVEAVGMMRRRRHKEASQRDENDVT